MNLWKLVDLLSSLPMYVLWWGCHQRKLPVLQGMTRKNNRGVNRGEFFGSHLEKRELKWETCTSDGAAATVGLTKGFLRRVKKRNPDLIITHCFLQLGQVSAKWAVCEDGLHGRYSHHLNTLNAPMQGWNENLPTSTDQRNGSSNMWQLERFPLTKKWQDVDTATLCKIIGEYWKTFEETMSFVSSASTDGLDWVRDPYRSKLFCSHFPQLICERWILRWALMTTWLCVHPNRQRFYTEWV